MFLHMTGAAEYTLGVRCLFANPTLYIEPTMSGSKGAHFELPFL